MFHKRIQGKSSTSTSESWLWGLGALYGFLHPALWGWPPWPGSQRPERPCHSSRCSRGSAFVPRTPWLAQSKRRSDWIQEIEGIEAENAGNEKRIEKVVWRLKIQQTRHSLSATSASLQTAQWHQHLQPGNVQSWVVLSEYLVKRMITTFLNHLWAVATGWPFPVLPWHPPLPRPHCLAADNSQEPAASCYHKKRFSGMRLDFFSLAWPVNLPATRKSAFASFAARDPFDHSQVVLSKSSSRLRSVRV